MSMSLDIEPTYRRLGVAVRTFRTAQLLTQRELAQRAGISRATLNGLERGGRVRLATVEALAEALSVSVSELFPNGERPLGEAGVAQESASRRPINGEA